MFDDILSMHGPSRRAFVVTSFTVFFALLLGCKTQPDTVEEADVPTSSATSNEDAATPAPTGGRLTRSDRQRLWLCAAQSADVERAADLAMASSAVVREVRDVLSESASERERYARTRMDWNVEWSPAGVVSWWLRWGHRGLEVHGLADSPSDVAELLHRLGTTESIDQIELEAIRWREREEDVAFALVQDHPYDSTGDRGRLRALVDRAKKTSVSDVLEQDCNWSIEAPGFDAPTALSDVEWSAQESVETPLHRLFGWEAELESDDAVLERLASAASAYDGLELRPTGGGWTAVLYELQPRSNADPAPFLLSKDVEASWPFSLWRSPASCEEPLCGVEISDAAVEKRVEQSVEMSRRAGDLRERLRIVNGLESASTSTRAFSQCLATFSAVAMADDEETSDKAHAEAQAKKKVEIEKLEMSGNEFELYYRIRTEDRSEAFPERLRECVESTDGVARAEVPVIDAEQSTRRLTASIHADSGSSADETPPWNSTGNLTDDEVIAAFAGENGKKWQAWLRDDITSLKRQLLLAREKVPYSLEDAKLLQRIHNLFDIFESRLVSFEFVARGHTAGHVVVTHRFRLKATVSSDSLPQILLSLSRMTRIIDPVEVRFEAGHQDTSGDLEILFDTYSFREK